MLGNTITSMLVPALAEINASEKCEGQPRSVKEFSPDVQIDKLRRIMSFLASQGVYEEHGEDSFLTTEKDYISINSKDRFRDTYLMCSKYVFQAHGMMVHGALQGDEVCAFERYWHDYMWDWLSVRPDFLEIHNQCMLECTTLMNSTVDFSKCYNWEKFEVICDLGGNLGVLLKAILAGTSDKVTGIVFDIPATICEAKKLWEETQNKCFSATRLIFEEGSFFEEVPKADCYILKLVLHDWTKDQCKSILSTINRCCDVGNHVVVIDHILPKFGDKSCRFGKFMDITVLLEVGGDERYIDELETMFNETGFKITYTKLLSEYQSQFLIEAKKVKSL